MPRTKSPLLPRPRPEPGPRRTPRRHSAVNPVARNKVQNQVAREHTWYDGANRRTVQKSYAGGVLDETRHLYYTQPSQWHVVEERVDAETDPDRQFVWGQRYIDDLVLRDRDTNGNGTLDERLYALQDANWNVTALVNASGDVQERVAYSAYGTPLFLTAAFVPKAGSSFAWETLYAGYRWETLTELFHVRHRVLNSVVGNWLQRDDIRLASTPNLYSYADSRPILQTDPTGQFAPLIILGVAIGAKELIAGAAVVYVTVVVAHPLGPGADIANEFARGVDRVIDRCIELIKRVPPESTDDICACCCENAYGWFMSPMPMSKTICESSQGQNGSFCRCSPQGDCRDVAGDEEAIPRDPRIPR